MTPVEHEAWIAACALTNIVERCLLLKRRGNHRQRKAPCRIAPNWLQIRALPASCHGNLRAQGVASAIRRLQLRCDAVKRKQAKHMSNRSARLTRFDAGNRLNVDAETCRRCGLPIACPEAGPLCSAPMSLMACSASLLMFEDMGLAHFWIVSAVRFMERLPSMGAERPIWAADSTAFLAKR